MAREKKLVHKVQMTEGKRNCIHQLRVFSIKSCSAGSYLINMLTELMQHFG